MGWFRRFVLLSPILLTGCGDGSRSIDPVDHLLAVIPQLSRHADRSDQFAAFYVEGAAPSAAERSKFLLVQARPLRANIDGNTAIVEVLVDDLKGHRLGQVTWSLVKAGGSWKLQQTPLP
ncbi:MAG TPA: hypothetical protein VL096_07655 [Pirellulaceae bacterium]|nr:hypothetical protein [Pirellulaceae bacterium]